MQVTVGDHAYAHNFLIGSIQDPGIIGLVLLEKWGTVVDVAKGKLHMNFGVVSLCSPDCSLLPFSFPHRPVRTLLRRQGKAYSH